MSYMAAQQSQRERAREGEIMGCSEVGGGVGGGEGNTRKKEKRQANQISEEGEERIIVRPERRNTTGGYDVRRSEVSERRG